jgi:hypothetical protein
MTPTAFTAPPSEFQLENAKFVQVRILVPQLSQALSDICTLAAPAVFCAGAGSSCARLDSDAVRSHAQRFSRLSPTAFPTADIAAAVKSAKAANPPKNQE